MIRKAILVVLAVTAPGAAPAVAQHSHGGDRNGYGSHGGDHDRGRDRDHDRGRHRGSGCYGGGCYRHDWRDNDDWVLGLSLGLGLLSLMDEQDYDDPTLGYSGYSQTAWNERGLAPGQCRWDRQFGYRYNDPAGVEVWRWGMRGGTGCGGGCGTRMKRSADASGVFIPRRSPNFRLDAAPAWPHNAPGKGFTR